MYLTEAPPARFESEYRLGYLVIMVMHELRGRQEKCRLHSAILTSMLLRPASSRFRQTIPDSSQTQSHRWVLMQPATNAYVLTEYFSHSQDRYVLL